MKLETSSLMLSIYCPELFARDDFCAWLNGKDAKMTWHTSGETPGECSDVVVFVDPGMTGEGSDEQLMPGWQEMFEQVKRVVSAGQYETHIAVRLLNMEAGDGAPISGTQIVPMPARVRDVLRLEHSHKSHKVLCQWEHALGKQQEALMLLMADLREMGCGDEARALTEAWDTLSTKMQILNAAGGAGAARSFHFDLGNSTVGPIGMSARVNATSPSAAVALLRDRLPTEHVVHQDHTTGEYIHVYFNEDGLSVNDIDEVDPIEDDGEGVQAAA